MPTDFARHAPDAMQCYADTLRTVTNTEWQRDVPDAHTLVARSAVYFWSSVNAEVVLQASRSYPLQEEMYVPSPTSAFVVFQRPVLFADGGPISALCWYYALQDGRPSIVLIGFRWFGGSVTLGNVACVINPLDIIRQSEWESQGRPVRSVSQWSDETTHAWLRWVATACMFVEQKIAVPMVEHVNKHVSARVAAFGVTPKCHVIQLRKVEGRSKGDGESEIEWACRWLVRGHWRRQFYPAANRRVPIWIDSYIKGPEDKPLRAPAPEIFAVTR